MPRESIGGFVAPHAAIVTLDDLKRDIEKFAPAEAGLQSILLAAALQTGKLAQLEKQDAEALKYARFVVAVRDLDRDVGGLANLVESSDPEISKAADAKLRSITAAVGARGAAIDPPLDFSVGALVKQAEMWRGWVVRLQRQLWMGRDRPILHRATRWRLQSEELAAYSRLHRPHGIPRSGSGWCARSQRIRLLSPGHFGAGWTPACCATV